MKTKIFFMILIAVFAAHLIVPHLDAAADGKYYRLRGSTEIHTPDCKKVQNADPGGVVEAKLEDGPPCFYCLRKKAK
jgi:hypothetical protein